MTLKEAYELQRKERLALTRENKRLKDLIDKYDKETYVSDEKAVHLKQISKLTWENKHLKNERDRYKANWKNQLNIAENFRVAAFDAEYERDKIKEELGYYRKKSEELEAGIKIILGESTSHNDDLKAQVVALTEALLKEKAKANNNGTNSGTPTSQTPYDKKKVIPNSRVRSGKKKGAQPGHEKHSLAPLSEDEISETILHELSECPDCGSENLIFIEKRDKDVIDYEVVLKKIRNKFYIYECQDCGHLVHSPVPLQLKESVQYGTNIQALGLALSNIGFVSVNRTQKLINSILGNGINLSEGFICKLQKRASKGLSSFIKEVRLECIKSNILHWDDTVIFINTKRGCMRFYGNDKLALYKAHEKKNREGIDEDKVLGALGPETTVIHDHVTMNYNDDFHFRNAECIQHLNRDIQNDEQRLITRINKYKGNHFLWVKDFSVAPTNNLAERSLRGQKVKLNVSGQFQSVETAGYFADIRTYTETCYRNGIDTFEALVRLTSGNPYTLKEVLGEA